MPIVEELEELDAPVDDPRNPNPAYWGPAGSGSLTALPGYDERSWRDGMWKPKPTIDIRELLPYEVKMKIVKDAERYVRVMYMSQKEWKHSLLIVGKFEELKSVADRNLKTIEPYTGLKTNERKQLLAIMFNKPNLEEMQKWWNFLKNKIGKLLNRQKVTVTFLLKTCVENVMAIDTKFEELKDTINEVLTNRKLNHTYSGHLEAWNLQSKMMTLLGSETERLQMAYERRQKRLKLFRDMLRDVLNAPLPSLTSFLTPLPTPLPLSDTESDSDHEAGV